MRSLQSARGVTITGGSLTLAGGTSAVQGAFNITGGTFTVRGAGSSFNATGATTVTGGAVWAQDGGLLGLANLANVSATKAGNVSFVAAQAGSVLDLPNLTEATPQNSYRFELWAYGGGRINAPRLNTVNGAPDFYAEDAGSQIDASGFTGVFRSTGASNGSLEARDGGSILMASVTGFERVDVTLRGNGQIPLTPVRLLQQGTLTLNGNTNLFGNLTNLANSSVIVQNGAKATLPGVTQWGRTNSGHIRLSVQNAESVLDMPNLTQATGATGYYIELEAWDGAELRLPMLSSVAGAVNISAEGAGAVVRLPATRLGTLATTGQSYIIARDGGAVLIPGVTDLQKVNLQIRGDGEIPTAQIRSVKSGEILLDATVGNFPALVNIEGSSLRVTEGAGLTLSGVTQIGRTVAGHVGLYAEGEGSALNLPNATQAAVNNGYYVEVSAFSGGQIQLPRLATVTSGALDISADGPGSIVNLNGFVTRLGNGTRSWYVEARNGGLVSFPNVTELDGVNVSLHKTGEATMGQLRAFRYAELMVFDKVVSLPGLQDVVGSGIVADDGAQLTLAGITQMSRTNSGHTRIEANDASVVNLPNLAQIGVLRRVFLRAYSAFGRTDRCTCVKPGERRG